MGSQPVLQTCGVQDRAAKLAELLRTGPVPHFVAYTSDYNLETGETWCPDCRKSIPGILSSFKEQGAGSLLLVQVGPKDYWKSPDHPIKQDKSLNVSSVPTLVYCSPDGREQARLGPELESSASNDEAKRLAAAFIAKAKQS